jgi:divalent metal cation (Fe/Co/Zn/Cd) transporter
MPVLDGVASVIIGVILAVTAAFLGYECQSLLTGEGVSAPVRSSIRGIASNIAGVERINELLTMHFGPRDVLVALSLDFNDRISAARVEDSVSEIERRIKAAHPEVTRVFIEAQSFEAHRRNAALGGEFRNDLAAVAISSQMNEGGVIFAGGIEQGFLAFDWRRCTSSPA